MHYIAVDCETTGLYPIGCRIIEIALVRFDGDGTEIERYSQLVNPKEPIPPEATAIHGIRDEDVIDCPVMIQVIPKLFGFIGDQSKAIMVAHNARFDRSFLRAELDRHGWMDLGTRWECTWELAKQHLGLRSHRLGDVATHLGVEAVQAHRAMGDALTAMKVYLAIRKRVAASCGNA